MNEYLKKLSAFVLIAIVLSVGYYGTYLPMAKSRLFISTMRKLGSAKSVDDVKNYFSAAFNFPSPIGQEEIVRNGTNSMMNIVQSTNNQAVISQVIDFTKSYYRPIVDRGKGMSFGQDLYVLGIINEAAFLKTKDPKYLADAQFYYERGRELGPNRPQPLLGLFDVYRLEGSVDGTQKIADRILSQWPNDDRTRAELADFLQKVKEFQSKKAGK